MIKWAAILFILLLVSSKTTFSQTDYYIGAPGTGPDGSNPQFSSLRQACDFLNSNVWDEGPIFTDNIFITSDLVEPAGIILTADNRPSIGTVRLSFSAMEGKSPVITFITCGSTAGTEYGLTINSFGVSINGITFQSDSQSFKNLVPLRVNGGNGAGTGVEISNCRILYKNKHVDSDSSLIRCALLLGGIQSGIFNCFVSTDFPGVSPYAIGIYVQNLDRCFVTANEIIAKKTGIHWNGGFRGTDILYNRITINEDKPGIDCYGILESGGITGSINIIGNQIVLSKNDYSANASATGISTISDANIINNMISGFYLDNDYVVPSSALCGIRTSSFLNQIVYNTIRMNDIPADINFIYTGIDIVKSGFLRNNIVVNEENNIPSFCINFLGDFLDADYNDYSINGDSSNTGNHNGIEAKSLSDWQLLTGLEKNSVAVNVSFVSMNDLHLAESSVGDAELKGIPVDGIIHDIDQELRHEEHPYMGADEGSVPISPSVLSVNDRNLPDKYELLQNYPNPFNPSTKIFYNLSEAAHVKLEICSITGEILKVLIDEDKTAGRYENYFTAEGLASGTYICRLTADYQVVSRKMVLLK